MSWAYNRRTEMRWREGSILSIFSPETEGLQLKFGREFNNNLSAVLGN
jgi:hypothetical protein